MPPAAAPPPSPAERFASILDGLKRAVAAQSFWHILAGPLIVLIWQRINRLGQRFARLAARIRAGRYSPRRPPATAPRAERPQRPPRQRNSLPQGLGWLVRVAPRVPLVPQSAAASASQLRHLLADPEMAALIGAAPAPMGRILRPLCHMLGVELPPVLALPARPRPKRPARPAAPKQAPPPRPPPPDMPAWMRMEPPRRRARSAWLPLPPQKRA